MVERGLGGTRWCEHRYIYSFLFEDLESSDWGTYHCAGYNKLGDESQAITLTGQKYFPRLAESWETAATTKIRIFLLNYLWSSQILFVDNGDCAEGDNLLSSEWYFTNKLSIWPKLMIWRICCISRPNLQTIWGRNTGERLLQEPLASQPSYWPTASLTATASSWSGSSPPPTFLWGTRWLTGSW